jgi:hypothetical protein
MSKRGMTKNEKTAVKIAELLNDVTIDLDQVGIYLGRLAPTISYNRLMIVAESAEFEKHDNKVNELEMLF